MHRVPEGLTHEMPSGGQREEPPEGATLLDSPGQDTPPQHTHTHLGLGSPSWSIKGWAGDQHREHLCSVINGQAASAGGEGLSTLWASRGSLLSSPLPPSGKTKDVSLAPTSSGQTQLAAVSSFWPLRSSMLPPAQTPQGPQKCP